MAPYAVWHRGQLSMCSLHVTPNLNLELGICVIVKQFEHVFAVHYFESFT